MTMTVSREDLVEMIDLAWKAWNQGVLGITDTRTRAGFVGGYRAAISSGVVRGREWRPIETAPKEPYTKVLGWCLVPVGDEVRLIQRDHAGTWTAYGATQRPTYWMPLPAPPIQQPDGGGR